MSRYFRIVHEPDGARPWLVLGDTAQRRTWVEVARFNSQEAAQDWVTETTRAGRAVNTPTGQKAATR